tara:strand:- start:1740 stop:2045 length:306 start_codon:yes stop_codon:yes gene_type:complete
MFAGVRSYLEDEANYTHLQQKVYCSAMIFAPLYDAAGWLRGLAVNGVHRPQRRCGARPQPDRRAKKNQPQKTALENQGDLSCQHRRSLQNSSGQVASPCAG